MKRLLRLAAMSTALCSASFAQARDQFLNATISGRGGDGKCTIEVNVDDVAIVEITGDRGRLITRSGQAAQWRRFECNQRMPSMPNDFRFTGVDGRGRQQLLRAPADNRGVAVIQIEDPKSGREGYTFDVTWRGGSDFGGPRSDRDRVGDYRERDADRGDRDRNDRDRNDRDRNDGNRREGSTFVVTCSSDDGNRHYCEVDTRSGVRLLKQRSGSECREGATWGYDRRGIWVDRGCRADFEVRR